MTVVTLGPLTLYQGDMLDILPSLENINCIITDPPFGLGKKMTGGTWGQEKLIKNMHQWDGEAKQEWFDCIYDMNVPTVMWGGNYYIVPPSQCWLMWQKQSMPTMADFEMAWTNLNRPAKCFPHPRNGWDKHHATQKPLALIKWCIEYTRTKGIICDPFAGSGITGCASIQLRRRCILIEKDAEAFDKMCEFLENILASSGNYKKSNPNGFLY